MSKSFGNVIAPDEVIHRYGAEILRLWVAAEDYRDDIRISEEHHGPPSARRYDYDRTYMLRGLTDLHLEFTPAE